MSLSLADIASICGGEVVGDASKIIHGVSSIDSATNDEIVFVLDNKHAKLAQASSAGAVLCRDKTSLPGHDLVVVENPQLAFIEITERFHPEQSVQRGTGDLSRIHESVNIPVTCTIGQFVSIGEDVSVGDNVIIGDGVKIEPGSRIGAGTIVHQNVVIKSGTLIGRDCRIHPGVVLGADGFGLAKETDGWRRIPQVGRLVIGDNVDIGANTTVDRGSLDDTVLGDGVKLDNLIQVGHNVRIGRNTVIAAHTAIAGSTIIGENCEIGGCVGVMDHSTIADNVKVGGGSVISGRISVPGVYSSSIKAEELSTWQKNAAWIRKLGSLADRIRKLEKK